MAKTKKSRTYDSSTRAAGALGTRSAILSAGLQLFTANGYAGTTMPAIAKAANVALDTVYATAGKKPELLRLLVETSLSGGDEAVPALQRDYVHAIRDEPSAQGKIRIYAAALRGIHPRLAPVFRVLQTAAEREPELKSLWTEIVDRRAANMKLFAKDLAATGELRADINVNMAADVIWSMNAPEFFLLLVEQRGWSPDKFEHWLADSWIRLLLKP